MTANIQSQAIVRVVDDDPDVRRSWQFVIEGEGWNVLTYASALEFLEKDSPFTPGCLVLDVRMPEMSGIELQHAMKMRGDTLPIIFISAHGDIDMAVKTMKDGAADFLSKPVTPERLLDAIERAVKRDAKARLESAALEQAKAAFRRLSAREPGDGGGRRAGASQQADRVRAQHCGKDSDRAQEFPQQEARSQNGRRHHAPHDDDRPGGLLDRARRARGGMTFEIRAGQNRTKQKSRLNGGFRRSGSLFSRASGPARPSAEPESTAVRGEPARSSPRRAPKREGEARR